MTDERIYIHSQHSKMKERESISPIPAPRKVYASLSFNSVNLEKVTELYKYAISMGLPFILHVDDEIPTSTSRTSRTDTDLSLERRDS